MTAKRLNLSAASLLRVGLVTTGGTLACLAVVLGTLAWFFADLPAPFYERLIVVSTVLVIGIAGPLLLYLSLLVAALTQANSRLVRLASVDGLTSCFNRSAFSDQVTAMLEKASEDPGCKGALLVIDADHFKAINDRFGHEHGDEALTLIAGRIRNLVRASDIVGRLGGEEFGVFLPDCGVESASAIAERIRAGINLTVFAPGGELRQLSVSIGGAVFSSPVEFGQLFRIADRRLYEAKQFGRNRVEMAEVDARFWRASDPEGEDNPASAKPTGPWPKPVINGLLAHLQLRTRSRAREN